MPVLRPPTRARTTRSAAVSGPTAAASAAHARAGPCAAVALTAAPFKVEWFPAPADAAAPAAFDDDPNPSLGAADRAPRSLAAGTGGRAAPGLAAAADFRPSAEAAP